MKYKDPDVKETSILISSEVLTSNVEYWQEVPENHSITIDEYLHVQIKPLD